MSAAADEPAGGDLLFKVGILALFGAGAGNWLAGNLAALLGRGEALHAGAGQALSALVDLPSHLHDPATAWGP
ncbi:MAG TPA: hypothetical protein VFH45_11960, partial [Acidimicrobiales bacterium]|nr:hypothetical protein [Acidimicrobiales bacterium]